MSFPRWRFTTLLPLLLGTLLSTLPASPAWAADPVPTARAQAILNSGLERIVSISAGEEGGVWALTDGGKLYHCRRSGEGKQARVECVASQGPVAGGY